MQRGRQRQPVPPSNFGSITYEICEWRARPPGAHSQKFIGNPTARARKMKIKLNFPKGTHINPKAKSVDTPNGNVAGLPDGTMERWKGERKMTPDENL